MMKWRNPAAAMSMLTVLLPGVYGWAQSIGEVPSPHLPRLEETGLDTAQKIQLQQALDAHNYVAAESLLLPEIEHATQPTHRDNLLLLIADVYYLNHDNLNAAIAWQKAEAIAPLAPPLQFSLAMAYVGMNKRDWARPQLQKLADKDPKNALYPYWLGRLDYDGQAYEPAIQHFQHAIQLDPTMARAFDNLGLCFSYLGRNANAIENFKKAIALDAATNHPSPWPHINLAAELQSTGDLTGAESHLREAIRLDASLVPAHFQLGNVLDSSGKTQAAIAEYTKAAELDPHYAEPHFALGRLYHRLGQYDLARHEVQIYTQLHHAASHSPNTP